MHEFAIARALIDVAEDAARRAAARRIVGLNARIGVLRQVDALLLSEAFAAARGGTACCDAELRVEPVQTELECPACRAAFNSRAWDWRCPRCGAEGENPRGGEELELVSIEVDDDDDSGDSQGPGEERPRRRREPCPV
jgi:hydrogenase nickel incorporation protein HypA/HybF